jgi:transcription antitermination factor NusG
MDTNDSRPVRDLQPGQRVSIKRGNFAGLKGTVTLFKAGGNGLESNTVLRVNVGVHGRTAPVEFINPTVDDLDCMENPPDERA